MYAREMCELMYAFITYDLLYVRNDLVFKPSRLSVYTERIPTMQTQMKHSFAPESNGIKSIDGLANN